jgi:hypothetical protein
VSVNTSNPLTYTLSGAPVGLTIDASGVVKWTTPVVGSYDLTVTAIDAQTKAEGIGVYTISVVAPTAPTVSASTVYGMPGSALSFQIIYGAGALEPLTFSLSGAPSGMAIGSTGTVTWAKPVLGTYNVNAVVKNSKTGLSGSATYAVKVQSTAPPTSYPEIAGPRWQGRVWKHQLHGPRCHITDCHLVWRTHRRALFCAGHVTAGQLGQASDRELCHSRQHPGQRRA